MAHADDSLILICEPCDVDAVRWKQTAIWQSGDRFYGLARYFGEDVVEVRIANQCAHLGDGWWELSRFVASKEFDIRKGEPWKRLKVHLPAWLTRMTL